MQHQMHFCKEIIDSGSAKHVTPHGVPFDTYKVIAPQTTRNTIAGLSLGERIFIYFEKIRFAFQKIEFLNVCFSAKKNQYKCP